MTADRDRDSLIHQYSEYDRLARIYHAYDSVHRCVHEPFSLSQPEALLNAARYVLALIGEPPAGVSMFCLCLCLAKKAKVLNSNMLARQMLDKILALQVPPKFQENVELLMLKSGGNIADGDEELSPLCWRCRRHVPSQATACPRCKHAFAYSFATHEVLPLVRFVPAEGVTLAEAVDLIERMPIPKVEKATEAADILQIDDDVDYSDPFLDRIEEEDEGVVECSRSALLRLNPACVLVVERDPLPPLYYRNMLPELPVTACESCHNLFYMEDYEIQMVTKGHCQFCRHRPDFVVNFDESAGDSPTNGSGSSSPRSPIDGKTWQ